MKLLLTAGPTREAIDPVRFLTNRSSGKMGYALASMAQKRGWEVHLVSGPVSLPSPEGVQIYQVESAQQMHDTVQHLVQTLTPEIAILSAAVSDYRPVQVLPQKFKKTDATWSLELEKTPDILASMRSHFGFQGVLVGFAAETQNLLENAQSKLQRKQCDLIVANDVSQEGIGFDSTNNAVTLLFKTGETLSLPLALKTEIASLILDHCQNLLTP